MQQDTQELEVQNSLLKDKTATLIQQNEDYSKLISELSRYYFHIKEATSKVEELGKLLRVFDSDLDQRLVSVWVPLADHIDLQKAKEIITSHTPEPSKLSTSTEQKFF